MATNDLKSILDKELEAFNAKHRRIRGTINYKYPPIAAACKADCGLADESVPRRDNANHRCVLAIGHAGAHQWSWECGGHGVKAFR